MQFIGLKHLKRLHLRPTVFRCTSLTCLCAEIKTKVINQLNITFIWCLTKVPTLSSQVTEGKIIGNAHFSRQRVQPWYKSLVGIHNFKFKFKLPPVEPGAESYQG